MPPRLTSLLGLVALVLAACTSPTPVPPTQPALAVAASVQEVVNSVEARQTETSAFEPVTLGYTLGLGGRIRTGEESRVRLDLNDGTIVRLAALSAFELIAVPTATDPATRFRLELGKVWANLSGGTVEVETPIGLATVRGSFAVFEYLAGDRTTLDDDILVVRCLEGECRATNLNMDETLGTLEQIILTNGGQKATRLALSETDVQDFIQNNPEAMRLQVTLTAIVPTATETPTLTPTPSATLTPAETSTPTLTPTLTLTPTPDFLILGEHTMRAGETLFCLGRGYGVLPAAIAQANGIETGAALSVGQVLRIPAVQWFDITAGVACLPQFPSPYPGLPTATPGAPSITSVPTNTPVPGQPSATPSATVVIVDTTPPSVRSAAANPTVADQQAGSCTITFSATFVDDVSLGGGKVLWQAYDVQGVPMQSGNQAMVFLSGTATLATWQAVAVVSVPPYGTVQWDVLVFDAAGNRATQPSGVTLNLTSATAGCP